MGLESAPQISGESKTFTNLLELKKKKKNR